MIKSVSYRIDAMYMTFIPPVDTPRLMHEFNKESAKKGRPYMLRKPRKGEHIKVQQGYDPTRAMMLDIRVGGRITHTITMHANLEGDRKETGFMMLAGRQLDYVPYEDIMATFADWIKVTRSDVAADLEYSSPEAQHRAHMKLCRLAGFDPRRAGVGGAYKQSKTNALTSGTRNKRSPIKTANLYMSNGLTLYIGGKFGKFRVRAYDKTAEVYAKTGEEIAPTLRIELQAKKELATAVSKHILNTNASNIKNGHGHRLAPSLWNTLADAHISFIPRTRQRTLGEVMGMDKAEHVQLDYSKIEGRKMEFSKWWRKQVAPSFNNLHDHMNDLEQLQAFWELTKGEPLDLEKLAKELEVIQGH